MFTALTKGANMNLTCQERSLNRTKCLVPVSHVYVQTQVQQVQNQTSKTLVQPDLNASRTRCDPDQASSSHQFHLCSNLQT